MSEINISLHYENWKLVERSDNKVIHFLIDHMVYHEHT